MHIIIIIIINITGIISCADNTSGLSPSGTTENTTTMVNGNGGSSMEGAVTGKHMLNHTTKPNI